MKNELMIFTIGPTTYCLNLNDEGEKKEALAKLCSFIDKDWTIAIYIRTSSRQVIDLYYSISGINYENLNKLYNYYDKDTLAPILMELKLKNRK